MLKLLSTIYKEILVLIRDRAGLAVIFLMPMALVFIVTLVQDAPFRQYQGFCTPLIFVDNDKGSLGSAIEQGLNDSDYFVVEKIIDGKEATIETARDAVAKGDYKVGIIVPEGTTKNIEENAKNLFERKFLSLRDISDNSLNSKNKPAEIIIYFDPAIQKLFKTAIINAINSFTEKMKSETMLRVFSEEIVNKINQLSGGMSGFVSDNPQFSEDDTKLVQMTEVYASAKDIDIMPNSVQQNVPAWTLFAMFFIVIPLAGSMIKERDEGSLVRLMTMPLSYLTILLGKIFVYLVVCVIQFLLMLMVGLVFLPMLGTPVLDLGSSPVALVVIMLSSAFAATGFGVAIGTIATSHEQASTFGAITVIIAAALGGIMMPVYLMPEFMQKISVISPLAWGLNAFLDIFMRGGNLRTIIPNAFGLMMFFLITMSIAVMHFKFKKR